MSRVTLFAVAFALLFTFCTQTDGGEERIKQPSKYPALNGAFVRKVQWKEGEYEVNINEKYTFDETDEGHYYSHSWSYTQDGGWVNEEKEEYQEDFYWKVEDSTFLKRARVRVIGVSETDWTKKKFSHLNVDSVEIGGYLYLKDE